MTEDAPPTPLSPASPADPPSRWLFDSRGDFLDAWQRAMARVAEQGCRELLWCDADYAHWPLGERATVEQLSRWVASHRRLVVVAAQFDTLQRLHPRWVTWRRQWSHVVQCRQVDEADIAAIPSLVLAPGEVSLRVRDPVRFRGRLSFERADAVRDGDDLDAFLQRSHEAFPVTSLGL
jgi:hypothetical protein